MEPIRIFIGFDKIEAVAFSVLAHSIHERSSKPVSITPITLANLKDVYWRTRDPKQSTDFSFSRFLVPYLCDYRGWAIWMDCDMLCRGDIVNLWNKRELFTSVQVIKHDYTPRGATKFLGYEQHPYAKKNWSSVMLFHCAHYHCRRLTPEYVNSASGLMLHQFGWSEEDWIGALPKEWNHRGGEYPHDKDAKLVHFTIGGPYFHEYGNCDYSEEWFHEYRKTMHADQLFVPRLRASAR